MSRKRIEGELEPMQEEFVTEQVQHSVEQVILKFEDLVISKTNSGTIVIDKKLGGISDHTYRMFASGGQKDWILYKENEPYFDTGSQHGNRSFHWEGILEPGLYTLSTGPLVKDFSKHRVPGRGYQITFRV